MGAIKAALTAIFNTNTYTSSTSDIASKKIPVTESNGLPSGQIGMSDLASVLGGLIKSVGIDIITSGDVNDIRQGTWQVSASAVPNISNLPANSSGILWVPIYKSGFWSVQIYITYASGAASEFYYRIGSGSVYYDWIKVAKSQ